MTSTSQHEIHPKIVISSYINTYSTTAPKTTLSNLTKKDGKKDGERKLNLKKIVSRNVVKSGILEFKFDGDRISPGNWCSGCQNGGTVILCVICEINSICIDCIDLEDEEDICCIKLECPSCFLKRNKGGKYPYRFRHATSTRQYWPTLLTTPLAIISIRLSSMQDTSSSLITYHHLRPWLQGNIVHVDFDFNFENAYNDVELRLNLMLDRFENGELKDWSRFFILITTHSDPNSGCLHISPNNGGSVLVNELFDAIFSMRFQNILKRSDMNVLGLLSCGAVSKYEESKSGIKEFAKKGLFSKIICFDQLDFQPPIAHSFLMNVGLQFFVYGRANLGSILRDHQELGAHTNVVEFQRGKISTFKWSHPGARPMGVPIINQCSNCLRLKSMAPITQQERVVVHQCLVCKMTKNYTFPPGWKWVFGPPVKGDERGNWLVRIDVDDQSSMDTT